MDISPELTKKMTGAEKAAIKKLVKSAGWLILVKHVNKEFTSLESNIDESLEADEYKIQDLAVKKARKVFLKIFNNIKVTNELINAEEVDYS